MTVFFGVRTWVSERSAKESARESKDQAAQSAEAAEKSAESQRRIAEIAERAFPAPKDFDFDIKYMQRGQFRLRFTGQAVASNIRFVNPEPPVELPKGWWPEPRWVTEEPITLTHHEWADFEASALSGASGEWRLVYPKAVTIEFDEAPGPVVLEMPAGH
ncbi:hypothetical protein [Nocardia wallacei]|uniref:hypothetical protein n=1 Tax=Nocardia wallacei TaxID=480035 RepID=UPI002454FB51|nr:hypothetical protein [Nocardia wallacei]